MSYNRPKELKRCIESISPDLGQIEIIVRDDASPMQNEINKVVDELKRQNLRLELSKVNGGFDKNFKEIISIATGEYILTCTDDDYFETNNLEKLLTYLAACRSGLVLSSFYEIKKQRKMRTSNAIYNDIPHEFNGQQIFDLILISGLIFRNSSIPDYDLELVNGTIYTQVFLSLVVGQSSGISYFNETIIICAEDGENGFQNSSDPKKQDRNHFLSNIGFHGGLARAVEAADTYLKADGKLISTFSSEYSIRVSTGLIIASRQSRMAAVEYWKNVRLLPIRMKNLSFFIFIFILLFGYNISNAVHSLMRSILHKIRT